MGGWTGPWGTWRDAPRPTPVSAPSGVGSAGAAAPPPGGVAPAGGTDGCCGFDWSQIVYEEFSSADPLVGLAGFPSGHPVVLSRKVKEGYYWFILGLSWTYGNANVRMFGQFLVPPSFATNAQVNTNFLYKDTISGAFTSIPKMGIRIRGSYSFNGNSSQSSQFSHAAEISPSPFIVPPGWALMTCADDPNDAPGTAQVLKMQVAYAELPIGTPVPGLGG